MTALADILRKQIKTTGPMTLAQYMSACLLHPDHGYYTTQDALGVDGDFTTSPEISQMFGEVIGLCVAQAWMDQGAPERFALVELGPGRGTLIADVMRATLQVPGFHSAAQLHLVEASDARRRDTSAPMMIRRSTVEHPFGTIKAWMGHTHFLTRRLPNVRTEMALNVLAYNIKRMVSLIGIRGLMAAIRA